MQKRNLLFSHHFIQIMPWRVNSLTPHILSAVEHIIKNLNPQMRHTDLIDIRETHRKAHIDVFHVLHHRIHLSADITGRFSISNKISSSNASFLMDFSLYFVLMHLYYKIVNATFNIISFDDKKATYFHENRIKVVFPVFFVSIVVTPITISYR